jgi:hypothetical protein
LIFAEFPPNPPPLVPATILRLRFPEEFRSTKDRRFRLSPLLFGEIFDVRIQTLATTLGTGTPRHYRGVARHFLSYLQTNLPQLLDLSELRRDPSRLACATAAY